MTFTGHVHPKAPRDDKIFVYGVTSGGKCGSGDAGSVNGVGGVVYHRRSSRRIDKSSLVLGKCTSFRLFFCSSLALSVITSDRDIYFRPYNFSSDCIDLDDLPPFFTHDPIRPPALCWGEYHPQIFLRTTFLNDSSMERGICKGMADVASSSSIYCVRCQAHSLFRVASSPSAY